MSGVGKALRRLVGAHVIVNGNSGDRMGNETVRILISRRAKMTPGKTAAQAVHAALYAYGIPHGRVVVLDGSPNQIRAMDVQVHDAGRTEVESGTLTAGASLVDDQ